MSRNTPVAAAVGAGFPPPPVRASAWPAEAEREGGGPRRPGIATGRSLPQLAALLLLFGGLPAWPQASPPPILTFQGKLTSAATDSPLSGDTFSMTFRLFDDPTAGALLWTYTRLNISVSNGLYTVLIGDPATGTVTPGLFSSLGEVFSNRTICHLEVEINGETLGGRTPVSSSPHALNALNLAGRPASFYLDPANFTGGPFGDAQLSSNVPLLGGRSGGQTLRGGLAGGESLTLDSTASAAKGSVVLAPSGGNVGVGSSAPGKRLNALRKP